MPTKKYEIVHITTTNLGNFGLYRGEIYLLNPDGKKVQLSSFINSIRDYESVTVDSQHNQGKGIHFGDIIGSRIGHVTKPTIIKDRMKQALVEELIKKEYEMKDGTATVKFVRGKGLQW